MSRNSIGKNLVLTSFGESHGPFIGAVLDGFPPNFRLDIHAIQNDMNRRRPGQSYLSSPRKEDDAISIISGVFEGKTTGSPIAILIANTDAKSSDYDDLKDLYRPGHADLLYEKKYGFRDYRGGGRSSARITAGWVAAGSLAKQWLISGACKKNIPVASSTQPNPIGGNASGYTICTTAWVKQIHTIVCGPLHTIPTTQEIESSLVRCPDKIAAKEMENAIVSAKESGDSLGGIVSCTIENTPIGLGEPLFGKLQSVLGQYLLSINAVKGISFGEGFQAVLMKGSEHNDSWIVKEKNTIGTSTNHAGGMIGGMATGEPIYIEIAFKPTSSIRIAQKTLNSKLEEAPILGKGRHDPCVLPRAVPIIEAMVNLAIMDLLLEPSYL